MGFFKAYDMRGTFGVDFDLETVFRVGCALPKAIEAANASAGLARSASERPRILVGRDVRETSESMREALVGGLAYAGADVFDLGLATTPMVYFFTAEDDFDGGIMITASHNPPSDNGLKVSMRTSLPIGYANGLNAVEAVVAADRRPFAPVACSVGTVAEAHARYVSWMRAHGRPEAYRSLRFAVDCSNGMASLFVRELFPEAEILNDRMDGRFPAHSPNPLKAEAREQLSACVRERGFDCGVIFDGDGDRAMFVDEAGAFIQPDGLIPIVARATRSSLGALSRGEKVLHDVRTSRGAIEALEKEGFVPTMVPVGHAFAKPALRVYDALCGGELAGHYYFREFHGCDSGVLAAMRVLGEIAAAKAAGIPCSGMAAPIVSRYANSGELNFRVADKPEAIRRVLAIAQSFGVERARSEIDGVRVDMDCGWLNVRPSNTEPYLRLVVECDTPERREAWVSALSGALVE